MASSLNKHYSEWTREGKEMEAQGNMKAAIRLYEEAIRKKPLEAERKEKNNSKNILIPATTLVRKHELA